MPPSRGDLRVVSIADVRPELDGGRFPVKRVVGEELEVTADILREGHGAIAAVLRYRAAKDTAWRETPMVHVDNDRWAGRFALAENTRYLYGIEAWADPFQTWARDLEKRLAAGMDVASELLEGIELLRSTLERAAGADRRRIEARLAELEREEAPGDARAPPARRRDRGAHGELSRPHGGDPVRPRARGRSRTGRPLSSPPGTSCSRARRAACPGSTARSRT